MTPYNYNAWDSSFTAPMRRFGVAELETIYDMFTAGLLAPSFRPNIMAEIAI